MKKIVTDKDKIKNLRHEISVLQHKIYFLERENAKHKFRITSLLADLIKRK